MKKLFPSSTASKKSVISKEEEKDYEHEVQKIEVLEECTKKLYRDMRKCGESMSQLARVETKMTQSLAMSPLCDQQQQLTIFQEINQSMANADAYTQKFNSRCQKTIVDPMKKFSAVFPSVNAAIKRRNQALEEYGRCQAKVDKYQDRDRTGPNLAKQEASKKALSQAKEDYEQQHQILMRDMPSFFEGRINYFQPCFEALVKSQLAFHTESYKMFSELASSLSQGQGEAEADFISDEEFEQQLQVKLAEIRSLSIVVDE